MKVLKFDSVDACTATAIEQKEIELHQVFGTWKPTEEQLEALKKGDRLLFRVCAEGKIKYADLCLQECVYQ